MCAPEGRCPGTRCRPARPPHEHRDERRVQRFTVHLVRAAPLLCLLGQQASRASAKTLPSGHAALRVLTPVPAPPSQVHRHGCMRIPRTSDYLVTGALAGGWGGFSDLQQFFRWQEMTRWGVAVDVRPASAVPVAAGPRPPREAGQTARRCSRARCKAGEEQREHVPRELLHAGSWERRPWDPSLPIRLCLRNAGGWGQRAGRTPQPCPPSRLVGAALCLHP